MSRKRKNKISECCDILDNLRVPINDEIRQTMQGNIPYYGANGIQGYIDKYIFDEDLILLAEDGGNFEEYHTRPIAYKISGKSWVNNHAHILRAKQEFNQDYIFYSLVHKDITKHLNSGTRSKLNKSELEKIEIDFPETKGEEDKIAKILSTADAVIEKTQAAIAKYKAIKQGMLQDLFTRGIDLNTYKLRPRYQEAPELYKESKLVMIPREWGEDVLGNIISVSSGEGLTQENIKPGIHLIYGGNGINGSHSDYLFEDSKLIIGRVGEYCGNAYITKPFSWVTDNALVVTPLRKVFLMDFWQYYLNFLDLNSLAFVGAQPVITGGLINKVVVKEIPEDEQILIAERLKAIDNKLQTEQTYLQKMQSLKKGLMEDLLSGRKQVKISTELKEMA